MFKRIAVLALASALLCPSTALANRVKLDRSVERAIYRNAPRIDAFARRNYGITGEQLLARLVAGEAGGKGVKRSGVSSAGARGPTQFIESTRNDFRRRYHIDPWRSDEEAIDAAIIHLMGKNGAYGGGLRGYNPGDPNYPNYILSQRTTGVGAPGAKVRHKAQYQRQENIIPGQSFEAERQSLRRDFLLQGDTSLRSLLSLRGQENALQDIPAIKTTRVRPLKVRASRGRGGHKMTLDGGGSDIVPIARIAQRLGLHVGENPRYGGVDPVHTQGSYHYKNVRGKGGRMVGAAIDVSGPEDKMERFASIVARRYGKDVEELIWRGPRSRTRKYGKHVPRNFYTGHEEHVHVADED